MWTLELVQGIEWGILHSHTTDTRRNMKYTKPIKTEEFFDPVSRLQVGDTINLKDYFTEENIGVVSGKNAQLAEDIAVKVLNILSDEQDSPIPENDIRIFFEVCAGLANYYQTEEGAQFIGKEIE